MTSDEIYQLQERQKKTVSGSNFKYYKQFYLSGYIYNKID